MLVKGLRQDVSTSLITGKKLNEAGGLLKVSWPAKQVYFAVRTTLKTNRELGRVKKCLRGRGLRIKIEEGEG